MVDDTVVRQAVGREDRALPVWQRWQEAPGQAGSQG